MTPFEITAGVWRWSVRGLLRRWVRVTIKPDDVSVLAARPRPVCYVLENESQADLAVLHEVCRRLRLPMPERRLPLSTRRLERAYFEIFERASLFRKRTSVRTPFYLKQLVAAAAADPHFDVDLVPVAIFWGRAPHKEPALWRLLFAEDWVFAGRFRKALGIIVNGRNTLVYFGEPQRLRDALTEGSSAPRTVRRILRSLRTALRAQRASTIGPDLSHRRTLVAQILKTREVRRAVRREMRARSDAGRPAQRRAVLLIARRHAVEIAANYSQAFITFMSVVLGRLWNWLYDGVEFDHVENLNETAGAEVIYVPCHRSHMDYLLLSYVIYRKGFAVPHVAAGINLNMPVVGRFLRKGGAFFLRRTFKGDPLYATVFNRYLGFMMARGHPLEYFVEGGRSRTGRLLTPRTGMLSMTVHSYLHDPKRPVVFVPVYFGYERIVEGRTYLGELSGRPKEKESVFGLLRAAASVLRSQFGTVYVNLGEPIPLDLVLRRHNPEWDAAQTAEAADPATAGGARNEAAGEAADEGSAAGWTRAVIEDLAQSIAVGINAAAAVTPVNLVAMALLATPRQALPESVLAGQLELYQRLLHDAPYGPMVTVTAQSGTAMIAYVQRLGMLQRQSHPLGDLIRMDAEHAVLATYYRNNILHLFALPSLLACCFIGNPSMQTVDLQRLVGRVYPYIAAELFLRWEEAQIGAMLDTLLDAFTKSNLLTVNDDRSVWQRPSPTSPEAMRLSLLAEATIQTVERYYLVVALLLQAGSGSIGQEALEERCTLLAQRMAMLYGLDSPEFFDKSLFRNFIGLLIRRGVVRAADGVLSYDGLLDGVAADAQLVLSEQIRHSILQVTLGQ